MDHQGEQDALDAEDGVESGSEDHGAYVFGGGGLEDVRATAGAVAHVVAYEVGDDGGVAGIVFRDAGFYFADEIGAYVGGLGVNAAAELGEEGDEGGSKAEAYELIDDVLGIVQSTEGEEEDGDSDEGERHDDEAGNGSAAEGGLQGSVEGVAGRRGGTDVGANRDVHSREPREAGADGADQEADDGGDRRRRGCWLRSSSRGR